MIFFSLIGTSAIETTGSTLLVLPIMLTELKFCLRLLLLPMVSESKFCLKRSRRCFRALLFVTSNVAKITLAWNPKSNLSPNIFEMMFTAIARAIEVFRFENGIVLIMAVWWPMAGVDSDRR